MSEKRNEKAGTTKREGKVYLVGAGPGNPGLMTVRAMECLKEADVIVYDRLVGKAVLEKRKATCECIYAGKEVGEKSMAQEEINELLIKLAEEGQVVVRLKGGDPFLFGRGGEEAVALRAHSIPFEVVPGASSALAVPLAAGIPLTHRGVSSSVAIATGHEDPSKGDCSVRWDALARAADTLVILMGIGNLEKIVAKLMGGGRAAETPVAVIREGTTSEQEVVVSTLQNVASEVRRLEVKPPAVIVVGEVVRLREQIVESGNAPLKGKRVLVTRPAGQARELSRLLRAAGAEPIELPLIGIVPVENDGPLREAMSGIDSFDWVIFTSANGVRLADEALRALPSSREGGLASRLRGVKVAAVGPGTARAARELGLDVAFVPKRYSAGSLAEEFPEKVEGLRVLLLRAEEASPALGGGMRRYGAHVEEVAVYRVEPLKDNGELRRMLEGDEVNVITLTSSSAVRSLFKRAGKSAREAMNNVQVACLGHVTAGTFRELMGRDPDIRARMYTMAGLVQAMIDFENSHGTMSQ